LASKPRRTEEQRGVAIIVVLLVLAIALALAVALSFIIVGEIRSTRRGTNVTQAFFAAEGGQEYGRRLLDDTMQTFSVPTATTKTDMDHYAWMAESGDRSNDDDIGVLRDFVPNFGQFLPRNEYVITGELGGGDNAVDYELAYDFTPTGVEYPDPTDSSGAYIFYYDYTIAALGSKPFSVLSGEQRTKLTGSFEVSVFHPSFSFYNFFTVNMRLPSGQQIYFAADEVLAGPVYVGSRPGFAGDGAGGGPTFSDQFQTTWASYATSSLIYNPVVSWNEEYPPLWGVDPIPVPTNALSQARISMGDYAGAGDLAELTNEERRQNLGLPEGTDPIQQGVYFAKGDGTEEGGNNTDELLGGLYVYGDVSQMRMSADGNEQRLVITQSVGTTTVAINQSTGSMTVWDTTGTRHDFAGTPNGVVYVDGTLRRLGGDPAASAAIQRDTQMTIAASGSIYMDNHIRYEEDPREVEDATNVLGLYSGTGNVLVADTAPSEMTIHAVMMATSASHGFGVQNYKTKAPSGNLNVLGGIIMDSYQAIGTFNQYGQVSGYRKNFVYDQRFLDRSFAPPYFPVVQPYVGRLRSILRTDWAQVVPEYPGEET